MEALEQHAVCILPTTHIRRPRRNSPRPPPTTRKERRKREYALIQKLYHADQKRCADTILNGHWHLDVMTAPPRVTIDAQEAYWGRLFTRPSPDDQRPVIPIRPPQWDMIKPITKELKSTFSTMEADSAAGPDGITVRMLESWPIASLAATLNLRLLTASVPPQLLSGRRRGRTAPTRSGDRASVLPHAGYKCGVR